MFKKAFAIILVLFLTSACVYAATAAPKPKAPYKTKAFEVQTKDKFIIKSKLYYPRAKGNEYPTIVLLHSLGYSSDSWGSLPETFVKQGYAVLAIDLRGHGLSNKDAKFRLKSWRYFTNKSFVKYPYDVITVMNSVKQLSKKVSFNNYAIIGGDIGANTAVSVAQNYPTKPKAVVLMTPYQEFKGINIYNYKLPTTAILVMCSRKDKYAVCQEVMLKTFAKAPYVINNTNLITNGMLIIKQDAQCRNKTIQFINKYLPPKKITAQ